MEGKATPNTRKETFVAFVIGRPGSGKSTLVNHLQLRLAELGLHAAAVSDYPYFAEIFRTSSYESRKYRNCSDGGHLILDKTIFDEALKRMCENISVHTSESEIVLGEFSRPNYCQAMKLLEEFGCRPNLVLYIAASFETCTRRNDLRRSSNQGHYVSKDEMIKTYLSDDLEALQSLLGRFVLKFQNEIDGATHARLVAGKMADVIVSFSRNQEYS